MEKTGGIQGHFFAIITIIVWGTTFISTKVLLVDFKPVEIIFIRFCIAVVALSIVHPHRLKVKSLKEELHYAAAGLCGVTLYFIMESLALSLSAASNIGVLVSVSPFFTALLASWFLAGEKPGRNFYIGFIIAITGIIIVSFNGSAILKLNPAGDFLAVGAAAAWAVYCIITRKISRFGHNTIKTTRRIFIYGLILMIPLLFMFDFRLGPERFARPVNVLNILYLGLGASATCFVTWNLAVKAIGAVKTSVYIYGIPVITVAASAILLNEAVTWALLTGAALILVGLFISERKAVKS